MAYIIFVNPMILNEAGIDFNSAMFATIISASLATLLMGLLANYPFALAPGMGLNAYFTYTVVLGGGHSWQIALGASFLAGFFLFILNVLQVREAIMNAIPGSLRIAIASGVGLFLAFIGLKNVGLITSNSSTFVTLGKIASPEALLTGIGLIMIAVLMSYQIRGAILIAIVVVWILSILFGLVEWKGLVAWPLLPKETFLKLDLWKALSPDLLPAVFSFLFVANFDTAGTLLSLSEQGNFLNQRGRLPRAHRALYCDAIGTMTGGLLGSSTITTYLESASGIAAGGRTGLTSVVVALLFLLALFFSPFASSIPHFATAPALIVIGALMAKQMVKIDWEDVTEFIPAFIILIAIPLTFSIANGIALGFVVYPILKLLGGKWREVNWITWLLFVLCILKFIYLP